jgi:signal transduction histidine kinase
MVVHGDRKRRVPWMKRQRAFNTTPASYLPRWRQPRVGYALSLLLVGLGCVVGLLETRWLFPFSFPGIFLLCAIVLVALLWGFGPAVLSILLSLLVLDYLYISPYGALGVRAWHDILQLLTFALVGIGIALLAHQYEAAFRRILALERERLEREREEAEQREHVLREVNQRMEASMAILSHELITSLTVIKGSLQLAELMVKRLVRAEVPLTTDVVRQLAPLQSLLQRAMQQVNIEHNLVNDLLDVSRIHADQLALVQVPCDLASIVREAVEEQRRFARARTIHLEVPAEQRVMVSADPDRIGQVVTNYLTNALKYSAADRPIWVRLEVSGALARVSVQDEGPGLPLTEQERIWELFYRVEGVKVQRGANEGRGIGLYICRTIIERYQGQVGIQSTPGKGSIFWFTLPLVGQDHSMEDTE